MGFRTIQTLPKKKKTGPKYWGKGRGRNRDRKMNLGKIEKTYKRHRNRNSNGPVYFPCQAKAG